MPILTVNDLSVRFDDGFRGVWALNGVSLEVSPGEILGVVGESGSGKTVTGKAIMGLLPTPPAEIVAGEIHFDGERLTDLSKGDRRLLNGPRLAMIFQDALTSLDPRFTVGNQIEEVLRFRGGLSRSEARTRSIDLLDRVGIPAPKQRLRDYPHQFSGGMRQRVMIAIAICLQPDVLIADEPTTALDVTIQFQVMEMLAELQREMAMSMIFITHDLALASEYCDRIDVMYAGQVVESAPSSELFHRQYHPYAAGLIKSTPAMNTERGSLVAIPGAPPVLYDPPVGCSFAPRCALTEASCVVQLPPLEQSARGRTAACFRQAVCAEKLSVSVQE